MTALLLPTWAGWVALTTWGLGFGTAGWMLGRWQLRRRFDRMMEVARQLRQATAVKGGMITFDGRISPETAEAVRAAYNGPHLQRERDRYRLAWLSARRRARRRANLCTSAAPTIGRNGPPTRCVLPAGHLTPHAAKPNPNWDSDMWWTDV